MRFATRDINQKPANQIGCMHVLQKNKGLA